MITSSDSYTTLDDGKYFYIANNFDEKLKLLKENKNFKEVEQNFEYNSLKNDFFLDIKSLKSLISNLDI